VPPLQRSSFLSFTSSNRRQASRLLAGMGEGSSATLGRFDRQGGGMEANLDLSALNAYIQCPSFKMETAGSILRALNRGQWLTSLDLKDAYFHIPIHPSFRHYLRFCHEGVVWQF